MEECSDLLHLLRTELQLEDTSCWEEAYNKFSKSLAGSNPPGIFFDMDGVLAAEVVGEGSLAVLVTSFFDHLRTRKNGDTNFVEPAKAHSILETVYSIELFKGCGFLLFLGIAETTPDLPLPDNLWSSLSYAAGIVSHRTKNQSVEGGLTLEEYQYLSTLYSKRYQMRQPSAYLCMKWIVQSSSIGSLFCQYLPPLQMGIQNFKQVCDTEKGLTL